MALKPMNVSQTRSAAALVFDALRSAIIAGDLKDGDPLRQDEIARLFNTSRIPVREAITMLEQQGLVKTQRYKGAVVVGLSLEAASEIFDFRCLVEAHVMRVSVARMTPEVIEQANQICDEFSATTDTMRWGDLNRAFHASLYSVSGLPFHLATLDNAMDRLDRYLRAQLLLTDGHDRADAEHRAIVQACAQGDADGAADLIVAHIRAAHASLSEHLAQIQSDFRASWDNRGA